MTCPNCERMRKALEQAWGELADGYRASAYETITAALKDEPSAEFKGEGCPHASDMCDGSWERENLRPSAEPTRKDRDVARVVEAIERYIEPAKVGTRHPGCDYLAIDFCNKCGWVRTNAVPAKEKPKDCDGTCAGNELGDCSHADELAKEKP